MKTSNVLVALAAIAMFSASVQASSTCCITGQPGQDPQDGCDSGLTKADCWAMPARQGWWDNLICDPGGAFVCVVKDCGPGPECECPDGDPVLCGAGELEPNSTVDTCANCPPGIDWIASCEGGYDGIRTSNVQLGVSLDVDCVPETVLRFHGPFTVNRSAPNEGVIDLEVVDMELIGLDGITLIAGAGLHNGPHPVEASRGTLEQDTGSPALADATINIYFEIEYAPGFFGYNHDPLILEATGITCAPPDADFAAAPETCIEIYDVPAGIPDPNLVVLVTFSPDTGGADPRLRHDVVTAIPTVSEWTLMVMTLLVLTAGTVVIGWRRRTAGA